MAPSRCRSSRTGGQDGELLPGGDDQDLYLLFDPDNFLHNRGNVATKVETTGVVCFRPRGIALLLGPRREGDQEQDRVGDCGHLEPGQDKRVLGRFSARKMLEKKKRRGEGIGRPRVEDSR